MQGSIATEDALVLWVAQLDLGIEAEDSTASSNSDGTVNVIHQESADHYAPVETVQTAPRAKTMALDSASKRLYLSTAEEGQFEILVVGKD
ncbi:MAG TPA: hypothetical protein VGV15_17015 [Terriglobales bacterium]|nr:hypothetical protein [Terriglobales bacterium]